MDFVCQRKSFVKELDRLCDLDGHNPKRSFEDTNKAFEPAVGEYDMRGNKMDRFKPTTPTPWTVSTVAPRAYSII